MSQILIVHWQDGEWRWRKEETKTHGSNYEVLDSGSITGKYSQSDASIKRKVRKDALKKGEHASIFIVETKH